MEYLLYAALGFIILWWGGGTIVGIIYRILQKRHIERRIGKPCWDENCSGVMEKDFIEGDAYDESEIICTVCGCE